MISKDLKRLQVKVYAGASLEETDKDLGVIINKAKRIELLLKKVSLSLRNGGYDNKSEFGKLYNELEKFLSK